MAPSVHASLNINQQETNHTDVVVNLKTSSEAEYITIKQRPQISIVLIVSEDFCSANGNTTGVSYHSKKMKRI